MSVRTFLLPDLGEGLTEAELVTWLVAVGDVVVVDQPVAEVETAKSLVEVPSPFAGRVAELHGTAGESLDVGRPLISVDTALGEPVGNGSETPGAAGQDSAGSNPAGQDPAGQDPARSGSTVPSAAAEAYRQEERAGSGNVLIGYGTPGSGQSSRRTRPPRRLHAMAASRPEAVPRAASRSASDSRAEAAHSPSAASGAESAHEPMADSRAEATTSAVSGVSANGLPQAAANAPRCISPLVRMLARQAGLRLAEVPASGPDGLILRRDVESMIAGRPAIAAAQPNGTRFTPAQFIGSAPNGAQPDPESASAQPVPGSGAEPNGTQPTPSSRPSTQGARDGRSGLEVVSRTPVRGLRRTVATNLSRSRALIPEATVWVDVDATALMDLRAGLARDRDRRDVPSLLAFLARFTLAGLARFPELNTRFVPADGAETSTAADGTDAVGSEALIEAFDGVNLGIAVQAERGLMVPAVRRADTLSTRELDAELRRLTAAAQAGRATAAELTSGTFTLNNYGVFGVDGSAAIINYPESAILGVGRIIDKPWVVNGELTVRKMTQLTLVFDHRVCDGGTAGGFLRYVADAVENPARVLADL